MRPGFVYASLTGIGLHVLARRIRDAGAILCYHNITPGAAPCGIGDPGLHLPAQMFERQIRWLARRYEIVPLREFVDRLGSKRSFRRVAALTFDDAYAGVFECAWPFLRTLKIPATVFVIAQAPGRHEAFWWDHPAAVRSASGGSRAHWLGHLRGCGPTILASLGCSATGSAARSHRPADWNTIAAAVETGLDVGCHSGGHRALPYLCDDELEHEVIASGEVIRREAGVAPEFFAYPYGLWDGRVREAVRSAGYQAAVTLDGGLNSRTADPWALRRVNVPATIRWAAFRAWTAGIQPGATRRS